MSGGAERPQTHHGTAIAMGGKAALLRGASGSGKSDLALRCLAVGRSVLFPEPVYLVCDDRAIIERAGDELIVSAPVQIAGLLEVRGLGIMTVAIQSPAKLVVVVDLMAQGQPVERLPDPAVAGFAGLAVPVMAVHPFEASAAVKVLMALRAIGNAGGAD